jgi:Sulfotransferase family
VLKAPSHLAHLPLVLDMYPDARIVVCHRDPLAMISSVTSLTATLRWGHAATVDFHALARENMDQFGRNLDAVLSQRLSGLLTDDQVVDVRFDDFARDQAGAVRRIAEHFGIPSGADIETAVRDHLAPKPAARSGGHQHSVDDLGIDIAAERERFRPYMDHFEIPHEVATG